MKLVGGSSVDKNRRSVVTIHYWLWRLTHLLDLSKPVHISITGKWYKKLPEPAQLKSISLPKEEK